MTKLTKHQRQYRKRKKDSEKDFRLVPREGKEPGVRVTRKPLKVNVSQEAYDRLAQLADQAKITKWQMLTRMIIKGIPGYSHYSGSMSKTERYSWPHHLLEPEKRTVKYKGTTGTKQINYSITSTAWKKLECHKTATGQSKARIIQFLILDYKPLSQEQLEKSREAAKHYRNESAAYIASSSPKPARKEPKFLDVGSEIIHIKGIPAEKWDDDELLEFEELFRKKCLRKLGRLTEANKQDTQEFDYWTRMLDTTSNLNSLRPDADPEHGDMVP